MSSIRSAIDASAHLLLNQVYAAAHGNPHTQIDLRSIPLAQDTKTLNQLVNLGYLNTFGPNIGFLTERGIVAYKQQSHSQEQISKRARLIEKYTDGEKSTDGPSGEYTLDSRNLSTASISIGRHENNSLCLHDQRASKHHAEIRFENGHFVLIDIGSANGTIVNGHFIQRKILEHKDDLVIGRTRLVFEELLDLDNEQATNAPVRFGEISLEAPTNFDLVETDAVSADPPPLHFENPPQFENPISSYRGGAETEDADTVFNLEQYKDAEENAAEPEFSISHPVLAKILSAPIPIRAEDDFPYLLSSRVPKAPNARLSSQPLQTFTDWVNQLKKALIDSPQLQKTLEEILRHPEVKKLEN